MATRQLPCRIGPAHSFVQQIKQQATCRTSTWSRKDSRAAATLHATTCPWGTCKVHVYAHLRTHRHLIGENVYNIQTTLLWCYWYCTSIYIHLNLQYMCKYIGMSHMGMAVFRVVLSCFVCWPRPSEPHICTQCPSLRRTNICPVNSEGSAEQTSWMLLEEC